MAYLTSIKRKIVGSSQHIRPNGVGPAVGLLALALTGLDRNPACALNRQHGLFLGVIAMHTGHVHRSEERRVGKECRARGSRESEKKQEMGTKGEVGDEE